MGTTQYIDAYQRANFWGTVQSNPNYHLLLGRTDRAGGADPESAVDATGQQASVFGFKAGLVDINWFDAQVAEHHQ